MAQLVGAVAYKDNIIRFTDNLCALLINKIKKFGEFLNFPTFLF